jgi:hypothetical protein
VRKPEKLESEEKDASKNYLMQTLFEEGSLFHLLEYWNKKLRSAYVTQTVSSRSSNQLAYVHNFGSQMGIQV